MTTAQFKRAIWAHYRRVGRGDLPWRRTRDPYAILVSEIMLQQTQAGRVTEFYKRFLALFPDFNSLSHAKTGDVLKAWQGLGYNRRAMFLKRAAEIVVERYGGRLPADRGALESLPGIGKGTSGSLMAFAFNKPEVFVETNIRRVFIHFFFPRKRGVTDDELGRYIKRTVDRKRPREWYWALMDYGAAMPVLRAGRPANPNRRSAHYKRQSAFADSDRRIRGEIVRSTLSAPQLRISVSDIIKKLDIPAVRFRKIAEGLQKEGFIVRKGNYICIKK